MEYQEMIKQATLYNEMLEILNRRPQLIAESENRIASLKKEIEKLESGNAQAMLTKLNPRKFFFKKPETIDVSELILKNEIEIRKEERAIEGMQQAKMSEIVDLDAVATEANGILDKQNKVLDNLKSEVIKAREAYHQLLDEYEKEFYESVSFKHTVSSKIQSVRQQDYVPEYHGDNRYMTFGKKVNPITVDSDIIEGHRKRAIKNANYY